MVDVGTQLQNKIEQRHEQKEEEQDNEIDLDDTIPALLVELGVDVCIACFILPHVFIWFWPRIRGILKINDSSTE